MEARTGQESGMRCECNDHGTCWLCQDYQAVKDWAREQMECEERAEERVR